MNGLFIVVPMENKTFAIIDKLGGRDGAFAAMVSAGYRGELPALRMMISRGRLSADAMRALMVAADRSGIGYSAGDFVLTADQPGEAA
ncbi:hypothetical protein [Magnetospirillum fulvum]|uniref:Uncharacterized protein n=1 Tax=Magnetospirillum fulvum MGU-K5 TaxID=1316936 RepID=S9SA26_MAGFU|nr:hypothetical protein [Magnetospirillum fulvum]EPY00928.1 hypothetical protein K678_13618 [Magnetospirillum fulvum MGU-K5]